MPRTLATVDSAVRVLEAFDADHTEWTLSALAAHLDQPTSTLHEQLSTLTASGLLMRAGRGRYRLGWRLLKLSSALYGSVPWYAPAHDAMNALARGTHLLAFLCVLQGSQVLCIARSVQGRDGPPVAGETQFVLPPHASASGKLLYALHGLDLPGDAPRYTPSTLRTPWKVEGAAIRAARLALTRDEWAIGTSGLAVPLIGAEGEVLGALGLSLPTPRLREQEQLTRRLRDAADQVAWALGYRPA
ncbi:IclR family transcriptional regulator (plasmid) [Deinococcus metallilatus]|uniref:IclR family transcriptional regulator n=1 Tax=Deinococcus metallilatus TaxID=1211322 RepID=A0AAJ5F5L7_9DEIO|nr:IclR family transcriptional regulator [Deinococcus metallilatus]MBB5293282.1 DNA-binding IclR family transcriptional regulator [Deinococcus metallilatus]QBY06394.1 IclR family transcriptional regulator [Deinococcus metallilatus]RXJ18073.1 IclR family transcriptional regulator [Deinococcus metallilatus]TLK32009.1 IclR family transcriptional regulator [Deinococcus metallilatus]GMA15495.1 IclR family transcriptional regulator [Deinococcus metallilatus]